MRIVLILLFAFLIVLGCKFKSDREKVIYNVEEKVDSTNIIEGYTPDHPINFPHAKHAKIGIDCKYCHSIPEAETASIPSVHLCINCHKNDLTLFEASE